MRQAKEFLIGVCLIVFGFLAALHPLNGQTQARHASESAIRSFKSVYGFPQSEDFALDKPDWQWAKARLKDVELSPDQDVVVGPGFLILPTQESEPPQAGLGPKFLILLQQEKKILGYEVDYTTSTIVISDYEEGKRLRIGIRPEQQSVVEDMNGLRITTPALNSVADYLSGTVLARAECIWSKIRNTLNINWGSWSAITGLVCAATNTASEIKDMYSYLKSVGGCLSGSFGNCP